MFYFRIRRRNLPSEYIINEMQYLHKITSYNIYLVSYQIINVKWRYIKNLFMIWNAILQLTYSLASPSFPSSCGVFRGPYCSRVAELLCCRVAELLCCRVAKMLLLSCKVTLLLSCKATLLLSFSVVVAKMLLLSCKVTLLLSYKATLLLSYSVAELLRCCC